MGSAVLPYSGSLPSSSGYGKVQSASADIHMRGDRRWGFRHLQWSIKRESIPESWDLLCLIAQYALSDWVGTVFCWFSGILASEVSKRWNLSSFSLWTLLCCCGRSVQLSAKLRHRYAVNCSLVLGEGLKLPHFHSLTPSRVSFASRSLG